MAGTARPLRRSPAASAGSKFGFRFFLVLDLAIIASVLAAVLLVFRFYPDAWERTYATLGYGWIPVLLWAGAFSVALRYRPWLVDPGLEPLVGGSLCCNTYSRGIDLLRSRIRAAGLRGAGRRMGQHRHGRFPVPRHSPSGAVGLGNSHPHPSAKGRPRLLAGPCFCRQGLVGRACRPGQGYSIRGSCHWAGCCFPL